MELKLGTKVWIHAMGSYYAGEVAKITETRALIRYTSGKAVTRDKWVTRVGDRYVNSSEVKYSSPFPLVLGTEPQPMGARALRAAA